MILCNIIVTDQLKVISKSVKLFPFFKEFGKVPEFMFKTANNKYLLSIISCASSDVLFLFNCFFHIFCSTSRSSFTKKTGFHFSDLPKQFKLMKIVKPSAVCQSLISSKKMLKETHKTILITTNEQLIFYYKLGH